MYLQQNRFCYLFLGLFWQYIDISTYKAMYFCIYSWACFDICKDLQSNIFLYLFLGLFWHMSGLTKQYIFVSILGLVLTMHVPKYLQGNIFLYLFLGLFSGRWPSFRLYKCLSSCCCNCCKKQKYTVNMQCLKEQTLGNKACWVSSLWSTFPLCNYKQETITFLSNLELLHQTLPLPQWQHDERISAAGVTQLPTALRSRDSWVVTAPDSGSKCCGFHS